MKFNEKLMELRRKEGLSQEELGYKLDVTRQTVSKWELGQTTPEMDKIVAMSKIFNISVDQLINESEETVNQSPIMEEQPIKEGSIKNNRKIVMIIVGILIIVLVIVIGKILISNSVIDKLFNSFNKATEVQENRAAGILDKATNIIDQVTEEQENSGNMSDEFLSVFNQVANTIDITNERYEQKGEEITIANFNGPMELFGGTNEGVHIKTLLEKIMTNNKTKNKRIAVKYREMATQNESEIENIKQDIRNLDKYEVRFDYDTDGFIYKAIIQKL